MKPKTPFFAGFEIKRTFQFYSTNPILLITLLGALFIGVYTYITTNGDIDRIIKVVGFILVIGGIWLNATRLTSTYFQREMMYDFQKKKAAQDVITEWYKDFGDKSHRARNFRLKYTNRTTGLPNLDEIRKRVEEIDEKEKKLIQNKEEEQLTEDELLLKNDVIPIVNFFEKIAIGVKNGLYDETIIKEYFSNIFSIYSLVFVNLPPFLNQHS